MNVSVMISLDRPTLFLVKLGRFLSRSVYKIKAKIARSRNVACPKAMKERSAERKGGRFIPFLHGDIKPRSDQHEYMISIWKGLPRHTGDITSRMLKDPL